MPVVDGRRRSRLALALLLVSCGPSVVLEEDDAGTTGDAASTSTGTSRPPDPVTTGSTIQTSPSDDDGDGTDSTGAIGSSTSTGEPGDGEGCGFLCDVDAGTAECDVFAQNCPPGEKCMPWSNDGGVPWNATRCTPVADDPVQVGEPCMVEGSPVSSIDDCDVGLLCWNVDENGNGVCEDMCWGSLESPICENPEDLCMVWGAGTLALCVAACHPLLRDCADPGCYPYGVGWSCAPPPGSRQGAYGERCAYANGCDPGNACVGAAAFTSCDDFGCCTRLCDLEDENADAMCQSLDPAQTCEPWYAEGQAPVGYANVGACMIAGAAP